MDFGFSDTRVFTYICGRPCFAITQEPELELNFCMCKLSRIASNPQIGQILNLGKIEVNIGNTVMGIYMQMCYKVTGTISHH